MKTAVALPVTDTEIPAHVRLMDVSKRLGQQLAVDRVSLDVPKGGILTLLGPSGCGKSTTLRLLAGLYQPNSGEILLGGERITHLPPNRRHMTMIFQEYALFPHLSVAGNVGYGLRMRKVAKPIAQTRIAEMLGLVGLTAHADKYPGELSGGQQQRVALARALAVDPEVLLLDEPLSNLDAKLRVRLREEIVRLQRVVGKTMVFVTHDQEEALSISDRIAVMDRGRVVQTGTPDDIYFRPANRYVADFIGLANVVDVVVEVPGAVRLGPILLTLPQARTPGPAQLLLRPEAVRLVQGPTPVDAPILSGRVLRRAFLGSAARYWVECNGTVWILDEPAPTARPAPEIVQFALTTDRAHLMPAP